MAKALQDAFIESQGKPVRVGEHTVIQAERLPIQASRVRVTFMSGQEKDCGVYLKAKRGRIDLSDGSHAETVAIRRVPGVPDVAEHTVNCPDGQLLVCNVYRVHHYRNGIVTDDMWTGNAGMVILENGPQRRVYGCSGGIGEFDPGELVVQVEWFPGADSASGNRSRVYEQP